MSVENANLVTVTQSADGIATITLNDPERRNAMSEAMATRFRALVDELVPIAGLRAVVLTGSGEAFSGGGHLDMLFEKTKIPEERNRELMESFYESFLSLLQLPVPVIAAINGHAIGAGLCLALFCDLRIGVATAKLGLNFVNLGLHPGMGATYILPRLIGMARANEFLFTGAIVNADDALRYGLLNRVVAAADFQREVDRVAETIAGAGPQAVRALKESLRKSPELSLRDCLLREARCQARDYSGTEFLEGITAAKEKRKPVFDRKTKG